MDGRPKFTLAGAVRWHAPTDPFRSTAEQQAEAERIHAALLAAAADDLRELADTLARTTDATIFGANEYAVRDIVLRVGPRPWKSPLEGAQKRGYDGSSRTCTHCPEAARFQRWPRQADPDPAGGRAGQPGLLPLPALRPGSVSRATRGWG